jgi:hypothetical protein
MSSGAIIDRFKPAGAGGFTMLLVGLCSKLPTEDQQLGILVASFIGPILTHLFVSAIHRYMVPTELAVYKKSLRTDIADAKAGLKNLTPNSDEHQKLLQVMSSSQILLATAGQDYYSGKITLRRTGQVAPAQQPPSG